MYYYGKVCSVYILFAPLILIIKCCKAFLLQNKFSQTFCIISITLNYQTLCFLEHSGHGLLGRLENKTKQKTFLKNLGFQLFGNCHSLVIFFRTSHFLVTPQNIIMLSTQLHRGNSVNGTNLTGLQLGKPTGGLFSGMKDMSEFGSRGKFNSSCIPLFCGTHAPPGERDVRDTERTRITI